MATTTSTRTPAAASVLPGVGDADRLLTEYLTLRIQQFLVSYGESSRLADIAQGLADDGVSPSLVRHTLQEHPARFIQVDRRWDVRTRYLDRQRAVSKLLEEIVATYDAPIAAWDAAHELGTVIHRSAEGTRPMVERLLRSSGTYAPLIDHGNEVKYGLVSWLLDVRDEYGTDAGLLFYNYLPAGADEPYAGVKADWENDPVAAALAYVQATPGRAPKVIDSRLLLYFAWKELQEDYDGPEIYSKLLSSGRLVLLPDHRLTDADGLAAIRAGLARLSEQLGDVPEEEEAAAEEAAPLALKPADLDEMARIVAASDTAVSAVQLLGDVYDINPGERTFAQDLAAVTEALRADEQRFLWVGYDRFRAEGSLPPFIGMVPESLQIPATPQLTDDNEDLLDQMVEDEGFERGLERDIRNALAMDSGDQDLADMTFYPNGETSESRSVRLVLKAHHKEIGTFPLCQIPVGFLPVDPQVVELTLRDTRGVEYQVYADTATQLIYGIGLFDLYATIPADSGAVITLERTSVPGVLRVTTGNETDDNLYVSQERMEQLQSYRNEVESGSGVSTHEIARYVLEHSNQAMTFLNLLTEVNIVRRTSRRQLASILSGWNSFVQKNGQWNYDPKKSTTGFNKNKRKYMI